MRRLAIVILVLAACGGRYPSAGAPHAEPASSEAGAAGSGSELSIEAAGLPFTVLDGRTGHQLDTPAFWSRLVASRAVCVGEEHPNPHHHWMQLQVVRELGKRLPAGTPLALGMEMFQRPFQGVLDDYAAHRIDAAALRSRAGWEDRWGYPYGLYGPTIDAAVAAHGVLLALNASKELAKKISHHGLESLTPDERAQVPELKLDDAAHRAWFDALMDEMGGSEAHSQKPKAPAPAATAPDDAVHHSDAAPASADDEMPSAERIYTVQVLWDETMADTAAKWLAAHPGGHVVILAGTGHCHDSAIVNRLKRRGIADVVSIRTVVDDGQGGVAEALAKPINDFIVVMDLPADVKAKIAADAAKDQ
jgi:uncharacterized iron-regulated protein